MPAWFYFNRPTNLAFHDLTTNLTPPRNLKSLLGLSLKFIPTPHKTTSWSTLGRNDPMRPHGFLRLHRDLHLRCHFAGAPPTDNDAYNPRMHLPSRWTPPPWTYPPEVARREENFKLSLKGLFKRRPGKTNLLPHQHRALDFLQHQDNFLIVHCDKNLGPAIIEKTKYIQMAYRDHLNDTSTYRFLSPMEASMEETSLRRKLKNWLVTYKQALTKDEARFLKKQAQDTEDCFPVFYLTFKVHKTPLKTRPILQWQPTLWTGRLGRRQTPTSCSSPTVVFQELF